MQESSFIEQRNVSSPSYVLRIPRRRADISAFGADLRSFACNCVDFELPSLTPPFIRLTTLVLTDSHLSDSHSAWHRFLHPTTLPSLRNFLLLRLSEPNFDWSDTADTGAEIHTIFHSILSLAPQLEAFAVYEFDEQMIANRLSANDWKRFATSQSVRVRPVSPPGSTTRLDPTSARVSHHPRPRRRRAS
jgi:hypothetical protein